MKKLILIFAFIIYAFYSSAQSPDAFNYQAVARDGSGAAVANTNIAVRFSVRDISAAGAVLYQERHVVLTNQFGLFTCVIGAGTVLSGTFSSVNWASDSKFLQVEFDPAGGTSYTNMSTSQLVSVPYAKVADVVNMFPGGVSNADKMVIQHSPTFPGFGLQYQDVGDKFNFVSNNIPVLTIDVSTRKTVGIGTASPASPLDVRGSVPSKNDTGLITVNNTGTGSAISAVGLGTSFVNGAVISAENKNSGNAIAGVTTGAGYAIYGYNSTGEAAHLVGDVGIVGDVNIAGSSATTGFTELGNGAPEIKMKKLTGTTAASQGGIVNINHGLTSSKILAVDVLVEGNAGQFYPPHSSLIGAEYFYSVGNAAISVGLTISNSSLLTSKSIKVLITYEQ